MRPARSAAIAASRAASSRARASSSRSRCSARALSASCAATDSSSAAESSAHLPFHRLTSAASSASRSVQKAEPEMPSRCERSESACARLAASAASSSKRRRAIAASSAARSAPVAASSRAFCSAHARPASEKFEKSCPISITSCSRRRRYSASSGAMPVRVSAGTGGSSASERLPCTKTVPETASGTAENAAAAAAPGCGFAPRRRPSWRSSRPTSARVEGCGGASSKAFASVSKTPILRPAHGSRGGSGRRRLYRLRRLGRQKPLKTYVAVRVSYPNLRLFIFILRYAHAPRRQEYAGWHY